MPVIDDSIHVDIRRAGGSKKVCLPEPLARVARPLNLQADFPNASLVFLSLRGIQLADRN